MNWNEKLLINQKPYAITMWDFSWLERRWPGAGYEDWDIALTELTERGYQAVRIDPYPHLLTEDPQKNWLLLPVWSVQDWGSKSVNRVTILENLKEFLAACRRHHVKVALSTWFREDEDKIRLKIKCPEDLANIWIKTLKMIDSFGELDNILYVDLCNEFPHPSWSPFFYASEKVTPNTPLSYEKAVEWMRKSTNALRKEFPLIPLAFSFCSPFYGKDYDLSFLNVLDLHLWMTNSSNFYDRVGYHFDTFGDTGYTNLALKGEKCFRENRQYYEECLVKEIEMAADWSRRLGIPLVSTECWSVVDYKDWPLLNWNWVMELCELGVKTAAATGCFAGMATSNFCGPQFRGMWREREWHQRLTEIIRNGSEFSKL